PAVEWRTPHVRPHPGREAPRLAPPHLLRGRARPHDRVVPPERALVAAADVDAQYPDRHPGRQAGASLTGPIPFFQHDLGEAELEAVRHVLSGPILPTAAPAERVARGGP